ncbi:MAG: carbohydrate ABC transporter permease [Clostridia bacterium]
MVKSKNPNKIKSAKVDKVFGVILAILAIYAFLVILIPVMHIVSSSFSSSDAVKAGEIGIIPVDFSLESYKLVFEYKDIWIGYRNTIYYTVIGTFLNVCATILTAYPLSRSDLVGGSLLMKLMLFTMLFSGGLIPTYMLVNNLGLIDTAWALWLPGLLSVYNVIVVRTFFKTNIPKELYEVSQIDGCSNMRYLWSIVIPLSGTIIAVMTLLYAIGHWNTYFNAMLYINDRDKFPLQLFLREILISNEIDYANLSSYDAEVLAAKEEMKLLLKYALIVVSSLPMMMVYPFIQKYIVKGVMIGSVKG